MDNDSIANLKFDSRMARRRGWVSESELEANAAKLPDVSDKLEVMKDLAPPAGEPAESRGE